MWYTLLMSKSVKDRKKSATLAQKKAFVAKSRSVNYRASLRLEGYESDDLKRDSNASVSKQELINRYRVAAG